MRAESIQLRKLLHKLGIKSAEVTHIEEMILKIAAEYGKPDQLIMSPSALDKFMETMYGGARINDKQESGSDAASTSDPLRDWFSVPAIIRNPKDE